jgi:hypothetical protein
MKVEAVHSSKTLDYFATTPCRNQNGDHYLIVILAARELVSAVTA